MRLPILRSSPEDQILYQTERYNEDTFGYEIPIREEGDYILVMKYAEVYFAQSQQKVTSMSRASRRRSSGLSGSCRVFSAAGLTHCLEGFLCCSMCRLPVVGSLQNKTPGELVSFILAV